MANNAFMLVNDHLTYGPRLYISGDVDYQPMPAPVSTGMLLVAGGTGGGGGSYSPPASKSKRKKIASKYAAFVGEIAHEISVGVLSEKDLAPDPLAPKKEISDDRLKEATIRTLRERITKLEARIRRLKELRADLVSSLREELEEATDLIAALRATVDTLEAELLRARVQAGVAFHAGRLLAGVETAPAENPGPKMVVTGLVGFILSELLIPDEWKALKNVVRVVSGTVSVLGAVRWASQ